MTRALLLLLLAGCATSLSPKASAIRNATADDVQGCRMVGGVTGYSAQSGFANQGIGR